MNKITTVGFDLAKNVFHFIGCDARGKIHSRKVLRRAQVVPFFGNLPTCLIGMEACSGAHYWARELQKLGHDVKLIPAQHVKAYLRGNKNDFNDALAIAEAVVRPEMRFTAIKTPEQQDLQLLNVQRQQMIRDRTAQANRIRALLCERGITFRAGIASLRSNVAELLGNNTKDLSPITLVALAQAFKSFQELDAHISVYDKELLQVHRQSGPCMNLQSIPGYGPVVSSLFYSYVGNGHDYRRSSDVPAALGIVPRQHSSGGKPVMLGISKRGNKQLRTLLIHGARAVVSRIGDKDDELSCWIRAVVARAGIHKATVAYANKMARMGWAVLRYNEPYKPGRMHLANN